MSKFAEFAKALAAGAKKPVRKNPRINPRANSKLLTVRQPTPIDPVEYALLKQWWSDYRLQYSAAIDLFRYEAKVKEEETAAAIRTDDAGEHKRVMELNRVWNAESRSIALEKLKPLLHQRLVDQEETTNRYMSLQQEHDNAAHSKLESLKILSANCITHENIEDKIDEILNSSVVDYNFVVNKRGHVVANGSDRLSSTDEVYDDMVPGDTEGELLEDIIPAKTTGTGTSVQV